MGGGGDEKQQENCNKYRNEEETFHFLSPISHHHRRRRRPHIPTSLLSRTYLMPFAHVVAYKVAAKNVHLDYIELSRSLICAT